MEITHKYSPYNLCPLFIYKVDIQNIFCIIPFLYCFSDSHICYIITAGTASARMEVHFDALDVERHHNCQYDSLEIRDGECEIGIIAL